MSSFSLTRISAIARKEIVHLRRDRLTGGMILGIPVMMTLLFGFAIVRSLVSHAPGRSGASQAFESGSKYPFLLKIGTLLPSVKL